MHSLSALKPWILPVLSGALLGASILYATHLYIAPVRDAAAIASGAASFKELSDRFADLARERGAVYAYEVLGRAPLPSGTDLHLLGHVIGDELYKQEGIEGIKRCTNDFRNACSHTIVIGAYNEFGEDALPKIIDACSRAPGGPGAYTMCFHGLGHGVFAYYGYQLPETIAACERTATKEHGGAEVGQCIGGAVMELMGGGGHDRDAWLESRAKYLSGAEDPLAPCNSDTIPASYKGICYQYLTPHLFEVAGADLSNPQPEHFLAAFGYCEGIPEERREEREACFGGIGKEFPTLAVRQDIRLLEDPPMQALAQVRDWCALSGSVEGREDCVRSVVRTLYWGGERTADPALSFCARIEEPTMRAVCVDTLIMETRTYAQPKDTTRVCSKETSRLCAN